LLQCMSPKVTLAVQKRGGAPRSRINVRPDHS
jgi:hypothetical protein